MSALPQEIIRRKRDGAALEADEIAAFIAGLTAERIGDAQIAAFAMAVFFNGMNRDECVALTTAMTRSGTVLDWAGELDGPVLDKHSTGGVGDKVSLPLAAIVAACGGYVPMISGRGLGHTGGTLDKLDAIPGYDTAPDLERFRRIVAETGCAIVGQTADLAPADRRLYAIRDVTATVESLPLITASILSKKLAAGLDVLVMDVKTGSGAFMPELDGARQLAEQIVAVANGAGLTTSALITDMNQVLGRAAGNAVEVAEAIGYMRGEAVDPRFDRIVRALAAEMLVRAGLAETASAAETRIETALAGGAAAERFQAMVRGLGGPGDLIERPRAHLPSAPVRREVGAERDGHVAAIDVRALGLVVVALGGGRRLPSDAVDHAVGLDAVAGLGEAVGRERPLALVHARTEADAERAAAQVRAAFSLAEAPPEPGAEVIARLDPTRP